MADLSTRYMGLELKNPIVASSSPLSKDPGKVKEMEDAGAAAVVLHSLFEEQVTIEEEKLNENLVRGTEHFAEALSYFPDLGVYKFAPDEYVEHIRSVKASVDIPILGSLNGVSRGGWIRYAREMESAGADGLELNIYYLPTDPSVTSQEVEKGYIELVEAVKENIEIPVAVKLSPYLSSIPNISGKLVDAGADALIFFNRFYQPDIDPEKLEVVPDLDLSTPEELRLRLRWVAILFGRIEADLAITGGVHSSEDVVKCMMAGARAAMTTSAILNNGTGYIGKILSGLSLWLEEHGYESVSDIHGIMSQISVAEPAAFERANYMKVLGSL